jgi:hypothetical protein
MKLKHWAGQTTYTEAKNYRCGYCGMNVAALTGYGTSIPSTQKPQKFLTEQLIALCPNCAKPTFWDGGRQVPGAQMGKDVQHLPEPISTIYNEARNCAVISAFTAGAMACRKILMNIAVDRGAPENQKFIQYVDYLANNGYVPPNGRAWVDHIRNKGNDAVHEIPVLGREDLSDLIVFTEMLLTFIYEFPNRIPNAAAGS